MKKMRNRKKYGFTLIEVMLVLAVGGAIIAMVFIAVPPLQRQARDETRREDVREVVSALKKYQQNNRGALPTTTGSLSNYLRANFSDPDGTVYTLKMDTCDKGADDVCVDIAEESEHHTIYIYTGATCDDNSAKNVSNPRNAAVVYGELEASGKYCSNT